MRFTASVAALALAFLQSSSAMNNALARKYGQMAELGLNPDGTYMDAPSADFDKPTIDIASFKSSLKVASTAPSVSAAVVEKIVPEYVELPIDNFAEDKDEAYSYQGTFFNRFWVAESGYKPGGPVFIYDAGEANAEPNALFRLQNETSFFKQIVDSFGGVGIVWEHRFCKSRLFCCIAVAVSNQPTARRYTDLHRWKFYARANQRQYATGGISIPHYRAVTCRCRPLCQAIQQKEHQLHTYARQDTLGFRRRLLPRHACCIYAKQISRHHLCQLRLFSTRSSQC